MQNNLVTQNASYESSLSTQSRSNQKISKIMLKIEIDAHLTRITDLQQELAQEETALLELMRLYHE